MTFALSKSDLAAFRQCPRRLWLEKHAPEKADRGDATTWRRARDGAIVGEKARELLGADVVWGAANPSRPAVEVTLTRDGLAARADALIPLASGYILKETKSSTFPLKPDKLTADKMDTHLLDDIAIQMWVMAGTNLPLARAELNLLDNQWRYPGNGDYHGLFRPWVVDESIRARVDQVPLWLAAAQQVLAGAMPAIVTGKQCTTPYPCPFFTHCKPLDPPGPEHPIELLPGSAGKKLARKLRESKGYVSLLEPEPSELTGKDAALYRRMQRAHRSGEAVLEADSHVALAALAWPRYYLDFEGIDLPVPRWAGLRPYEHVPFQWSCHIEREDREFDRRVFEHREFLDLSGDDPSLPCIAALLAAIAPDGEGPIFVYTSYERTLLRGLAKRHPQHAAALQSLIERLVDLRPVVEDHYYHPDMRGSFSIKKVLPTFVPDLDYGELGGVTDGTAAQVAYLYAVFEAGMTEERKEAYRRDLLRYCERDTWAMVELAWHLQRRGRPVPPESAV
jgi:hypothetical protein